MHLLRDCKHICIAMISYEVSSRQRRDVHAEKQQEEPLQWGFYFSTVRREINQRTASIVKTALHNDSVKQQRNTFGTIKLTYLDEICTRTRFIIRSCLSSIGNHSRLSRMLHLPQTTLETCCLSNMRDIILYILHSSMANSKSE